MSQDLVSLTLTPAEITKLNSALDTIDGVLVGRGTSLTPAQRKTLIKMGDKSRNFCEQAVTGLQGNSSSLSPDFPLAALTQDLADYTALDTFYTRYGTTGELIDDTLKALSSDVMLNSIAGVTFLKAINKLRPGLDTLLKNLSNIRRSKPAPKAPKTP